jgi:hypothetical protein
VRATEADAAGDFELLVSEQSESLQITAESPGCVFPAVSVVPSAAARVPDVLPTAFLACFVVDALPEAGAVSVAVRGETKSGRAGERLCFALPPGQHAVSVAAAEAYEALSAVVVDNGPPGDTAVRQSRAALRGSVALLAPRLPREGLLLALDGGKHQVASLSLGVFCFLLALA